MFVFACLCTCVFVSMVKGCQSTVDSRDSTRIMLCAASSTVIFPVEFSLIGLYMYLLVCLHVHVCMSVWSMDATHIMLSADLSTDPFPGGLACVA